MYIFIGGGTGAICRFLISKIVPTQEASFPTATLLANIVSCIILGFLMAYLAKKGMDQKLQWLLMTGFCGGFSTFSTFSAESFKLIDNGNWTLAGLYITASVLICTLLLFFAYVIGSKLWS